MIAKAEPTRRAETVQPYVVIPWRLVHSMPAWWQKEFRHCMNLLSHAFGDLPFYKVRRANPDTMRPVRDPLVEGDHPQPMIGPEPGDQL